MTDKMHTVSKTKARARAAAWLLLAALPLSGGCGKESGGPGRGGSPSAAASVRELEDAPMSLGSGVETKTMWDTGKLTGSGNKVAVRDYLYSYSEWDGTNEEWKADKASGPYLYIPKDASGCEEAYTDRMVSGREADVWAESGRAYFWTYDGVHRFASWLTYDKGLGKTAKDFFGVDLKPTEPSVGGALTLTIPAVTFTPKTPQFDFIYSDVAERDLNGGGDVTSPVPFTYRHLFTAFSVGIRNESSSRIRVKEFRIEGLPDTKEGVKVTFPVGTAAAEGTDQITSTSNAAELPEEKVNCKAKDGIFYSYKGDGEDTPYIELPAKDEGTDAEPSELPDLFNTDLKERTADEGTYLLWPLTEDELGKAKMVISYESYNSDDEIIGFYNNRWLSMPIKLEFEAGKINRLTLVLSNDTEFTETTDVTLRYRVEKWTKGGGKISFD